MQTNVQWQGGMSFESNARGHLGVLDAKEEVGGQDLGPTPKELLLIAISGCTGMDVVSLLKKMRVHFERLNIQANAEMTQGVQPTIFKKVELHFNLEGSELDVQKVEKAVSMSMTKYCGVSAMVSKASPIYYKIFVNGDEKSHGQAEFTI